MANSAGLSLPATPTAVITPPVIRLAPITDAAMDEAIRAVRTGYSNKVGLKLSTAGGGAARIFGNLQRGRLEASGYIGAGRSRGVEAGAEITFDLGAR